MSDATRLHELALATLHDNLNAVLSSPESTARVSAVFDAAVGGLRTLGPLEGMRPESRTELFAGLALLLASLAIAQAPIMAGLTTYPPDHDGWRGYASGIVSGVALVAGGLVHSIGQQMEANDAVKH